MPPHGPPGDGIPRCTPEAGHAAGARRGWKPVAEGDPGDIDVRFVQQGDGGEIVPVAVGVEIVRPRWNQPGPA